MVFVKGCLIGKGNVKRGFIQTFFLAPHAKGYYGLNDIFRFVNKPEPVTTSSDDKENDTSSLSTPNQGIPEPV